MDKDELRAEMKKRLRQVGETRCVATGIDSITDIIGKEPKTVFSFLNFANEIDTSGINELFISRGAVVAAPKVQGTHLSFYRIESARGPFATGAYGIREPEASAPPVFPSATAIAFPVLVLVPGLAFSREGNRLGRGAGFYDRFLTEFLARYGNQREDITIAGVCHAFQILAAVPTETHDIPVDCLLTEKNAILCI